MIYEVRRTACLGGAAIVWRMQDIVIKECRFTQWFWLKFDRKCKRVYWQSVTTCFYSERSSTLLRDQSLSWAFMIAWRTAGSSCSCLKLLHTYHDVSGLCSLHAATKKFEMEDTTHPNGGASGSSISSAVSRRSLNRYLSFQFYLRWSRNGRGRSYTSPGPQPATPDPRKIRNSMPASLKNCMSASCIVCLGRFDIIWIRYGLLQFLMNSRELLREVWFKTVHIVLAPQTTEGKSCRCEVKVRAW